MKAKEIRDLIDFISQSGLEEVNIETEEFKIQVKRSNEVISQVQSAPAAAAPIPVAAPAPTAQATPAAATPAAAPTQADDSDKYVTIKSPMIGTFYRSANPESAPFVNVGDSIKAGQTACIIEAMKLFNEIESDVNGTIVKVLVDNAQPVEYDQPLFLVDPA
ncbi:MAG: acetyl-CoA carboxylase biotin carboxyl carrier protein [Bacteroidota bacterium]